MQKRELFINSKLVVGLFFQNRSEIVNQNNPNTKKDVLESVNDILMKNCFLLLVRKIICKCPICFTYGIVWENSRAKDTKNNQVGLK